MKIFTNILLIMLLCLLDGCYRNTGYISSYGTLYNAEREKRQIPIIPNSWTIQDIGDYFDCFDPNPNLTKPHRLSKRVCIGKNGELLKEVDSFYSGKSFVFLQNNLPQQLVITYDYSKENRGNPWSVIANLSPEHFSEEISIQEADRQLAMWGLTRTNTLK